MVRRLVPLSIAAVLMSFAALAVPATAAPVSDAILEATLSGANEVPGPGDPDGTGEATVYIDGDTSSICVSISVSGIAPATAAHIHTGPAGVNGPVLITIKTPKSGSSFECKQVNSDILAALVDNPEGHYVNVHNVPFPAGAIRGQLTNPYA